MLPHDITQKIVQHVVDTPAYDLDEWKSILPLLAVCRQWRTLALPRIFEQVFISTLPSSSFAELYSKNGSNEDAVKLISNIGLVTICSYRQMTKSLDIRIEDPQDILSYINDVNRVLSIFPEGWKGINTLRINIMLDELAPSESSILTDDMDADLSLYAMRIVDTLPNITHIELQGTFKSITCTTFVSKLVDSYSLQLHYLDSSFPLSITALQFSDKLEHLSLEFANESESIMPYIPACNLKHLSLRNIRYTSIWGCFYNRDSANYISFNKLKRLCVTFNSNLVTDANTMLVFGRLAFPALLNLSIGICRHASHLLTRSTFPSHIKLLQAVCPRGGVMLLTDVVFDLPTRREFAQFISNSGAYANLTALPNFLAGPTSYAKHISFHIDALSEIADDAAIMWTNLDELIIDSKVRLEKLLCLILEMPRLSKLEANKVVAGNFIGNVVHSNINDIGLLTVSLLSERIQDLSICFYSTWHNTDQKAGIIKFTMERITSHQKLAISTCPYDLGVFV